MSGAVLFAFLTCHMVNHAFGLKSIEAMETAHGYLMEIWRTAPGGMLLGTAFFVHYGIALATIFRRRTIKMPLWEAAQLASGLVIPLLLVEHIIGTRVAEEVAGIDPSYGYVVTALWVLQPISGIQQTAVAVIAWTHGCIGLHFWLRLKPWYARWRREAIFAGIVIPVLSLAGFAAAGFTVLADERNHEMMDFAMLNADMDAAYALLAWANPIILGFAVLGVAPFAARLLRDAVASKSRVVLMLPDGAKVPVPTGATALEALRAVGRPHAAVCGGRGRCTTCRVRVIQGADDLAEPSELETKALARIKAVPGVRLACQIRPRADLGLSPLLPPTASAKDGRRPGGLEGDERQVSCLFIDMRGSTKLGEEKLPYDVLFILNQFFSEMSLAIDETDGHYAQFAGDGLMALYGLTGAPEDGAKAALRGARAMLARVEALNESLATELPFPLKVGIGLHFGDAIVGAMGPPKSQITSAIGDTINTAARLESLTKEHGVPLIVSEDLARVAGLSLPEDARAEVTVRGRSTPIGFYRVADVAGSGV